MSIVACQRVRTAPAALLIATASLLPLSGCAFRRPVPRASYWFYRNDPEAAMRALKPVIEDPERSRDRNYALYLNEYAVSALHAGDYRAAKRAILDAGARIDVFLAGTKGERDALSLMGREGDKEYKGEPHERSMNCFYRGMLCWLDSDLDNALAMMKRGMENDQGSYRIGDELKRFEDDYVVFPVLAGRLSVLLGEEDEAERFFAKAEGLHPGLAPLIARARDRENNVTVIIESGRAPRKVRTGPHGSVLGYAPDPEGARPKDLRIDGIPMTDLSHTDDLHAQATTLGGRKVDQLNKEKAAAKEAIDTAGDLAILGGAITHNVGRHSKRARDTGLALMAGGFLAKIFAGFINPSADTRNWETMPGELHLAFGRVPPGTHDVALDVDGANPGRYRQRWFRVPFREDHTLLVLRILPERGKTWVVERSGLPRRMEKPDQSPPVVYCFDTIGHRPGAKPFILGGTCCCTPTAEQLEVWQAEGHFQGETLEGVTSLYQSQGIELASLHHHGCNNLCEWGPHVVMGGRCMVPPTPCTPNYEKVFSGTGARPAPTDMASTEAQSNKEGEPRRGNAGKARGGGA